jgi:hypothetical protein
MVGFAAHRASGLGRHSMDQGGWRLRAPPLSARPAGRGGRAGTPRASSTLAAWRRAYCVAFATRPSTVMPFASNTCGAGADRPKESTPSTLSAYLYHAAV